MYNLLMQVGTNGNANDSHQINKKLMIKFARQTLLQFFGKHFMYRLLEYRMFFFFFLALHSFTANRLSQLVERQTAVREVAGTNLDRTNTRGLKITEEKVLPLLG